MRKYHEYNEYVAFRYSTSWFAFQNERLQNAQSLLWMWIICIFEFFREHFMNMYELYLHIVFQKMHFMNYNAIQFARKSTDKTLLAEQYAGEIEAQEGRKKVKVRIWSGPTKASANQPPLKPTEVIMPRCGSKRPMLVIDSKRLAIY